MNRYLNHRKSQNPQLWPRGELDLAGLEEGLQNAKEANGDKM